MGDDGRARVLDFGLARPDEAVIEAVGVSGSSGLYGLGLTQAGSFVGTPAYMAPEQFRHEPADAQSDQFSFCVALFEALYGHRPFLGADLAEVREAVLAGRRGDPPEDTLVPGWASQVLARGLCTAAEQRFPTMTALLAAIEARLTGSRRTRAGLAAIVLGSGLVAAAGGYAVSELRAQSAPNCAAGGERLVGAWDPRIAESVRAGLVGSGAAYTSDVAAGVATRLASYATAWADSFRDACEAHQSGEQSDALHDLRMACLEDRRVALRALTTVLSAADAAAVEKAVQAADRLPLLARCADASALLAQTPPPEDPEVARATLGLGEQLAQVRARVELGQFQAALLEIPPLRRQAERLGYAPTIAAALHLEGLVEDALGEYAASEAALLHAVTTADGGSDDDARAAAMIDLARAVGLRQARFDEGLRHAELARGSLQRLADRGPLAARLELRLAEILLQRGDFVAAQTHIEAAIALHAQLYGEASTVYAAALDLRASLRFLRAEYGEALAEYRRVAAIYERAYGAQHPSLGKVLNNIGAVQLSQFDYAAAGQTYGRALEILRAGHGADHPSLATVYSNLGLIALGEAQFPRAIAEFERALAIYEASLSVNHPSIGDCLQDLGEGYALAGRDAEAVQTFERALAVAVQGFGAGHERSTRALARLGAAQLRAGRGGRGRGQLSRARSRSCAASRARRSGWCAPVSARVQLQAGEVGRRRSTSSRRRWCCSASASAPHELAEVQFTLAQALWARGPADAARARSLAGGGPGQLPRLRRRVPRAFGRDRRLGGRPPPGG
jgi:tetratricopeptide (TPR) repeat protein